MCALEFSFLQLFVCPSLSNLWLECLFSSLKRTLFLIFYSRKYQHNVYFITFFQNYYLFLIHFLFKSWYDCSLMNSFDNKTLLPVKWTASGNLLSRKVIQHISYDKLHLTCQFGSLIHKLLGRKTTWLAQQLCYT